MILMFMGCFSIVSEDFYNWKNAQNAQNTQLAEETGFEIQDFGIEVSEIPAGSFQMGCTEGDAECEDAEYPVHEVEITRPFALMTTEVTQGLYEAVMGEDKNISIYAYGGDFPVETVSWFDAVRFANELSRLEGREQCYSILESDSGMEVNWIGFDCKGWRLPTEAEWEYAARGGEDFVYAGSNNPDEVALYSENIGDVDQTQRVAQLEPNGFGLYDMSGNVYEWVWNWYGDYSVESQSDPTGALTDLYRLVRGGSWFFGQRNLRVSSRDRFPPILRERYIGFRLGRSLSVEN